MLVDPLFVDLVARESLDEDLAGHLGMSNRECHNRFFVTAQAAQYSTYVAEQRVKLTRRQLERLEQLSEFFQFSLGSGMITPVSGDGSAGFDELFLKFSKADRSLFRIRAGSRFVFAVVIHV